MTQIAFSKAELERYSRHLIIPEFNIEGQRKLKASKVLVVGTGGLGSPLLLYLAAAGVGTIGIVDFDKVDDSNLQRQVLYSVDDVGKPKVEAAKKRLQALNPYVEIRVHETMLTSDNALEIIKEYDLVADGTDNFPTRYLVNDACVLLGKTNVYASIFRFEGQVSVFNYTDKEGNTGPNYRDLFPEPPPPGLVPSCAEGGVIGVLPGIIGSLQANEVIKVITGVGEPLAGRLFLFDAASFTTRTMKVPKDPENPLTGTNPTITELIDYEQFCGMPAHDHSGFSLSGDEAYTGMQEISVEDLHALMQAGDAPVVLDVRDPHEWEIAALDGTLRIPKGDIQAAKNAVLAGRKLYEESVLAQIPKDKPLYVMCRSGQRSADSILFLNEAGYDLAQMYNVRGGILAWASAIDPTLPQY